MQPVTVKGFRLSIQQARLWSLPWRSPAYHALCRVGIEGNLDPLLLQLALQKLVARHSILRTQLYCMPGMDIPAQVIVDHGEIACPFIDLRDMASVWQEAQVAAYIQNIQIPAIEQELPLHCAVWHLSPLKYVLILYLPAFYADAATLKNLTIELVQIYDGCIQGQNQVEEPLQYSDVAAWQDDLVHEDDNNEQRAFWQRMQLPPLDAVPIPFERQAHQEGYGELSGQFRPQLLDVPGSELWSVQLQEAARGSGASLEAFLLACWQAIIWRLTDQSPVVIGVECDGRYYEELASALGLYSRVVPVVMPFIAQTPFTRVITLAHSFLEEAKKRQMYFLWDTLPEKEASATFPLSFAYEEWPANITGAGLTFSVEQSMSSLEPFVIKLHALCVGQKLQLRLCFDPRRLPVAHAQRLANSLCALLQEVAVRPGTLVSDLPIQSLRDQAFLRQQFNVPPPAQSFQTIIQAFEARVERYPEQVAVVYGEERLTYDHLNVAANRVAHVLRRSGVGSNVLVGLYVERSIDMLTGILAILKAGGAYVPLDPDQPEARLTYQLQDLQTSIVLTQVHLCERLSACWNGVILVLDDPDFWEQEGADRNLVGLNNADDLAYVIYTSGSTGVPKGVMIRHGGVTNYTTALCNILELPPGLHFATVSTLAADLGNTSIFCALVTGGCLHIMSYAVVTSGEAFADYVARSPIDVLKIVPSHVSALLTSCREHSILPRKYLLVGGEAFSSALLQQLEAHGGTCCVLNHYGPTETTIGALVNTLGVPGNWFFASDKERDGVATIPIGRPIAGMEAYILDRFQQVVPVGVTGELYLGGMGLAAGYWHQPEQTRERFVAHPWSSEPDAKLYRTGDLAVYRADGTIEFIGRADTQIKLRGYRVEPGEIEEVLSQHPAVRASVVVLREDIPAEQRLVAYIVARQPVPAEEELRHFVGERLPGYMVPSFFVFLRALPLNTNGKINRHLLPAPRGSEGQARTYIAPSTPLEEIVVGIWQTVLQARRISVHDNFASVGGHSLLATQIISRIRQALHIDVPLRYLFEAPTVAGLSARIAQMQSSKHAIELPPLVAVPRDRELPLSFAQRRLWILDQLTPNSAVYLIPRVQRLRGRLNVAVLEQSLVELTRRHEVLRTTFQEQAGQPIQVIHAPGTLRMPLIDLGSLGLEERIEVGQWLAWRESSLPCDLMDGPLMRVSLLRLDAHDHVLLLIMHHSISDAWSRNIAFKELSMLYNAFLEGRPSPLLDLQIQYADYAIWQQSWLQGSVLRTQLEYWTHHLEGISALDFPSDYPRPAVQTFNGAQKVLVLPAALNMRIKHLSQSEGTTLFMTLLAAFNVLLAYYTGKRDIAVGTPIANRAQVEIEGLIGFFTNTLVMRTDLTCNPSFLEVLTRVREVALEAYTHQDVPFEMLVETLQPERDLSRSPLFQVMFVLQHAAAIGEKIKELALDAFPAENKTAKFDLTLSVTDTGEELRCSIEYNTDLFAEHTITSLLDHWSVLLNIVASDPQQRLNDITLLTEDERRQVLVEWNATGTSGAPVECVHAFFEEQVRHTPDAVAVLEDGGQLTYLALNQQANQLACYLHKLGVGPDQAVGICLERSLKMAISVLAVLKAGGACLPLDPSYPSERLDFMLKTAHTAILVTQQSLLERLPFYDGRCICVDRDWPLIAQESTKENLAISVSGENLLYVIYTSGSTGIPKGIGLPHRALVNLLHWHFTNLMIGVRTLQFASLGFDASFHELFATWGSGGTLVMLSANVQRDVTVLASFLSLMAVEKAIFPVVVLHQLAEEYNRRGDLPIHLREITSTGEQLQITSSLIDFFRSMNDCTLHNHYGPSESHVVTAYTLDGTVAGWTTRPAIGRPIANTQIYLCDEHLHPVPTGVPGEIYIGGTNLARGYLDQPVMTAERFIPHPFSEQKGMRLYKTGDLACYWEDGTIEYLGRIDHQVKIRGYRIELGEIEALLSRHPGVDNVVVIAREDVPGDRRLVAYMVMAREVVTTSNDLLAYLGEQLPEYMLPSAFVVLDALPLTSNGKVDQRALPHPEGLLLKRVAEYMPPQTEIEQMIAALWQKVLYVEKVGLHDNFFDLGGHSLLAIRVHRELQTELGRDIALIDLFKYPTVSTLAQSLSRAEPEPALELQKMQSRAEMRRETARHQQGMRKAYRARN